MSRVTGVAVEAVMTWIVISSAALPKTSLRSPGDFALQALDGNHNRMADAATNSGLMIFQLTNANARLTATTRKQYYSIKKLLTNIKLSSSSTNISPNTRSPGTGAAAADHKTIKLLQTAIRNCWSIGGFCSSHGWGVVHLHTSSSCKNKAPGHIDTVTRSNPAGPGATRNKGWDDFV